MPAIQTRPIANDRDFLALRDAINPLMARYGFPLVPYKGSASWLAGAADPARSTETFFKLLYRGRGKPYVFGIRADYASGFEKLKALQWPIEFSVMPTTSVIFRGFETHPGETDRAARRVEKILKALPKPDPSRAIPLNGASHDDFDEQLDAL